MIYNLDEVNVLVTVFHSGMANLLFGLHLPKATSHVSIPSLLQRPMFCSATCELFERCLIFTTDQEQAEFQGNVHFDSPPPRYGTSPIWIASSEGHVSCVEALFRANADVLHLNKCVSISDLLRFSLSLLILCLCPQRQQITPLRSM